MTAGPEALPAERRRPARRALDDLSLKVSRADLGAGAAIQAWPDWLSADRSAAFDRYEALPVESSRLYTPYLDLRAAQLATARLTWSVGSSPAPAVLPDGADGLIDLAEGDAVGVVLSDEARAQGVVLTTFGDLLARDPAALRELLEGGRSLPADDKLAHLTRALWSQGLLLDIPAGARLARPIVVRWSAGAPDRAILTRTIVRLGDGASAALVEEMVSSAVADPAGQSFLSATTEVLLGRNAELAMASIQDLPGSVVAVQHRHAALGEGAALRWAVAQLGGRLVRSRVDNRLEGDRSRVEQVEIVFGSEDQLFDLTSYTRHIGRDTTGELLSKGALLDRARSFMKGMIDIERTAVGTDSYLGEFGMNLSKQARAVAIPSLEIDQPDCRRAAHSSSVGPIDETQLFYLQSRGIPLDEARKFIVLGFLEPVVARVPLPEAQDLLRGLLEAKWAAGTRDTAGAAA
jgi:Fe-S cluster assembly scaffold protein SufB